MADFSSNLNQEKLLAFKKLLSNPEDQSNILDQIQNIDFQKSQIDKNQLSPDRLAEIDLRENDFNNNNNTLVDKINRFVKNKAGLVSDTISDAINVVPEMQMNPISANSVVYDIFNKNKELQANKNIIPTATASDSIPVPVVQNSLMPDRLQEINQRSPAQSNAEVQEPQTIDRSINSTQIKQNIIPNNSITPTVQNPVNEIATPVIEEDPLTLKYKALLDKLQSSSDESQKQYQQAKENERNQGLFTRLGEAAGQIGAGYASTGGSGQVSFDPRGLQALREGFTPSKDVAAQQAIETSNIKDALDRYLKMSTEQRQALEAKNKQGYYDSLLKMRGDESRDKKAYFDKSLNLREKEITQKGDRQIASDKKLDEKDKKKLEKEGRQWADKVGSEITKSKFYKDYSNFESSIKLLESALAKPNAYKDMGAIYKIMKTFDPESVVRESEYKVASNAGSLSQKLQNFRDQALSGTKLQGPQRQQMLELVQEMKLAHSETMNNVIAPKLEIAKDYSVSPEKFLPKDIYQNYSKTSQSDIEEFVNPNDGKTYLIDHKKKTTRLK